MGIFDHGQDGGQLQHITQEMYRQNLELAERNSTLSMLRKIDEAVLNPNVEPAKTVQAISEILTKEQNFNLAIIYTLKRGSNIAMVEGASFGGDVPKGVRDILFSRLGSINLSPDAPGTFALAAKQNQIYISKNFRNLNPEMSDAEKQQLHIVLNIGSMFICPLRANNRVNGVMILGSSFEPESLTPYQKSLAERLSAAASIAIENKMLYQELQEAGTKLQIQNTKLKSLDKTKDEFISMASHQLLTPLTAIKGYISMVVDGTVGQVQGIQKDMLKKAYDGSQKMVYLVTDLLNVSRIQSGKFIIDNKPTNLADLVQAEVEQLMNAASGHKLNLVYHRPEIFPTLMLDDNKIRQVVMNFIDNAIYYTPAGGQIVVELKTTPQDVIFTVTDNGVGVPAHLQHQLFTKFYRADNAKQMRPDGTGIGLFMAKKVIIAQGGAVIFKSVEGRGSTFGFSFPLSTTLAPSDNNNSTDQNVPVPAQNPITPAPNTQN